MLNKHVHVYLPLTQISNVECVPRRNDSSNQFYALMSVINSIGYTSHQTWYSLKAFLPFLPFIHLSYLILATHSITKCHGTNWAFQHYCAENTIWYNFGLFLSLSENLICDLFNCHPSNHQPITVTLHHRRIIASWTN